MAIWGLLIDYKNMLPLVASTNPVRLDTLGALGSLKPTLPLSVTDPVLHRVAYCNLALSARIAAFGTSSDANHNGCLGTSEFGDK